MKNRLKMALCALLLAAGCCGCEKDSFDIGQLVGSWYKVYPEGVVADGSVTWTFGADHTLRIEIYDVFANDTAIRNYTWRVSDDGKLLTLYDAGGESYREQFKIGQCSRHRLSLTRIGEAPSSEFMQSYTFRK